MARPRKEIDQMAERAAAERAAATTWKLSEREQEIVRGLGGGTDGHRV